MNTSSDEFPMSGVLKIANKDDRLKVAAVLFDNGYAVKMVRKKKNGKTYEYYIDYSYEPFGGGE